MPLTTTGTVLRILFLTSRLPFPPIGGDRLRTFALIRHLKKRHALTIVSFVEDEHELENISAYRDYYDRLITVPLSRAKSYFNCVLGVFTGDPLQVHYYRSARMRAAVAAELAAHRYDVVVSHLIRMAQYLPEHTDAQTWVDFTDAISLYHARRNKLSYPPSISSVISRIEGQRVGPYERALMRRADRSLFISGVDADWLSDPATAERVVVLPNGVDLAQFPYTEDEYDPDRIIFLGNMRTFPNTDAVLYFARDIFPLIRRQRPAATFHIVGNQPSGAVRALHDGRNIMVTGTVPDVAPYLRGAAVQVATMRACSGVQNKIIEAMAVGTPVVATTMGAEGLDATAMRVADAPADIAREVLEVMANPELRRELARAGRAYVERELTWEAALAPLDELSARSPAQRTQ